MDATPAIRSMVTGTRREFVVRTSIATVGLTVAGPGCLSGSARDRAPFSISLAQWSLHRMLSEGRLHPLDFPEETRTEYGLNAVEYVNTFYRDLPSGWTGELRARCEASGIRSLLIMCDGEGRIGDPDPDVRIATIENHARWLDAAAELGCHSIRVNAASEGSREEQSRLAADGLHRLAERALPYGLNVLVENHGGLSSDGAWLAATIRAADHPSLGTLPDFGNWRLSDSERYDPYRGLAELMPLAKAVSAKSHDFGPDGEETGLDYGRLLRIVHDSGYRGWIGIEYEGDRLSEPEGIRATKALLDRTLAAMTPEGSEEGEPAPSAPERSKL